MTTVEFYKKQVMPHISLWHPCEPRNVFTVSDAYDLWLPNCDNENVFFICHWMQYKDAPLYAGNTRFEFIYGQVSDFNTYGIEAFTEPEHYRDTLQADEVVLHWHVKDWQS